MEDGDKREIVGSRKEEEFFESMNGWESNRVGRKRGKKDGE